MAIYAWSRKTLAMAIYAWSRQTLAMAIYAWSRQTLAMTIYAWSRQTYYCFFYFSRIGDYVLNWSNTSFPCFMNFKARGAAESFKVHKTWKSIVEPMHKSNTCVPAETAHSQDSHNSITSPGQTQLVIIKTLTNVHYL